MYDLVTQIVRQGEPYQRSQEYDDNSEHTNIELSRMPHHLGRPLPNVLSPRFLRYECVLAGRQTLRYLKLSELPELRRNREKKADYRRKSSLWRALHLHYCHHIESRRMSMVTFDLQSIDIPDLFPDKEVLSEVSSVSSDGDEELQMDDTSDDEGYETDDSNPDEDILYDVYVEEVDDTSERLEYNFSGFVHDRVDDVEEGGERDRVDRVGEGVERDDEAADEESVDNNKSTDG